MYLKEIREAKGITQQQLADMLGIRRNTVSRYETGDREPDQATLVAIAGALNTTTDYLLTGDQSVLSDTPPGTIKNAPTVDGESVLEKRIGFYGETKKYITDDDLDDIAAVMRAKAERNKQKAMQDDDTGEN